YEVGRWGRGGTAVCRPIDLYAVQLRWASALVQVPEVLSARREAVRREDVRVSALSRSGIRLTERIAVGPSVEQVPEHKAEAGRNGEYDRVIPRQAEVHALADVLATVGGTHASRA